MRQRTVAFLLFPGFEPLDAFGPLEAFAIAEVDGQPAFRTLVLAESTDPVAMRGGPGVVPDHALAGCPPLDVLLVPGGPGTRTEHRNPALTRFLAARAADTEIVASVCTGAALLGAAGLLSGRAATTNRRAFQWVASVCPPDVRWDRGARWVDAGRVVTAAGVSAGLDMALHLVARLLGEPAALRAAERMEYRWRRDPREAWPPVTQTPRPTAEPQ